MGLGGVALALAAAAPPLTRHLRARLARPAGTPQGAPVSPLLSNIYLHPFDAALTRQGFRLLRFCDDFVILCRDETQARAALAAATATLRTLRLQLHPGKTRLTPPLEPFGFLGYEFHPAGQVVPPANIPTIVARRVTDFARRTTSQATRQAAAVQQQAGSLLSRWRNK